MDISWNPFVLFLRMKTLLFFSRVFLLLAFLWCFYCELFPDILELFFLSLKFFSRIFLIFCCTCYNLALLSMQFLYLFTYIFITEILYIFYSLFFSTGAPFSYFPKILYSNLYFQPHFIAEILFWVDVLFFLFSSLTNLIAGLFFSFDRNLSRGTRITSSELKIHVYFYQITSSLTKRVYTMVFKVDLVINDESAD